MGRGAIDRILINSVGRGLTLNYRIDAESFGLLEEEAAQWEDNTEREFSFWAESKECDITRGMNFYELQNLCFKSVLLNGDALVMLPMRKTRNFPYDLRIALIEGDRLQNLPVRSYTAMIDGGVEFDIDGKPIAYHITNRHPYSEITGQPTLEYVRVPAFGQRTGRRNVLHLLPMERISQHKRNCAVKQGLRGVCQMIREVIRILESKKRSQAMIRQIWIAECDFCGKTEECKEGKGFYNDSFTHLYISSLIPRKTSATNF